MGDVRHSQERTEMILPCVLILAVLAGTPVSTESDREAPLLVEIRAEDRERRAAAFTELRHRLESGAYDEETIHVFLLAGLETDHGLRMGVSFLIELIPIGAQTQLIKALSDPRPEIRGQAVAGLGTIGPAASESLSQLLSLLSDEDEYVAIAAGIALSEIDSTLSTFPYLLSMLRDDSAVFQLRAAEALDRFDDRVRSIVNEIIPLLNAEDENLRYWLVNVIANTKFSEPAVVKVLARLLLEDPSPFVRTRVAREFWELGNTHQEVPAFAINALVEALQSDRDDGVKEQVAMALASAPELTRKNHEALEACVGRESGAVRETCRDALQGRFE